MGFCDGVSSSLPFPANSVPSPLRLRRSGKPSLFRCSRTSKAPAFRCSNNEAAAGSSAAGSSYTRRWINPTGRRPSPEIVRNWVENDPHFASEDRFTVASYNILGDKNASKHWDLYPDVPPPYMKWERRKRVICDELIVWDPDIICLQEVDRYFDLSMSMEGRGYVGSYKRRTGDSVDGCAIFWRANKFRLLESESIEFKAFGLRDNVAQLSVFEMCKDYSRRLVVGNIHVLFRPSRGEIKLGQIRLLSSRAQSLSHKWGDIPVLLSGDFNTTPQSAIYKFLSTSELDISLLDRRELSGQRSCHPSQVFGLNRDSSSPIAMLKRMLSDGWSEEEIRTAGANAGVVSHPLKLNSSYASVYGSAITRDLKGEPLATSYHSKFFGTVDYIWYTDGLVATRVLDTPSIDMLRRTGGLPCKNVGSDHLGLVSEFSFADRSLS